MLRQLTHATAFLWGLHSLVGETGKQCRVLSARTDLYQVYSPGLSNSAWPLSSFFTERESTELFTSFIQSLLRRVACE